MRISLLFSFLTSSAYASDSQSGRYRPPGINWTIQGVEWGSLNGQGVNEKLLGSTGGMKPPIQNYC